MFHNIVRQLKYIFTAVVMQLFGAIDVIEACSVLDTSHRRVQVQHEYSLLKS